jgi:hypothetical protein
MALIYAAEGAGVAVGHRSQHGLVIEKAADITNILHHDPSSYNKFKVNISDISRL